MLLFIGLFTSVGLCLIVHFWQYKCRYCRRRWQVQIVFYGWGPSGGWWKHCRRCDRRWKPKNWCVQDERIIYHAANGKYPTKEWLDRRFKHMDW